MPEPGANESKEEYISRCIKQVMDDGTTDDEKQAAAICYEKWDKKSVTITPVLGDELKIGARNNRRDAERLQGIHDYAVENGAMCGKGDESPKSYISDDSPVYIGGAVKVLGQQNGLTTVGGYLITFGNPDEVDLTNDYFTPDTNYMLEFPGKSSTWFNHCYPVKVGGEDIVITKSFKPAELTLDKVGVFATAVLDERDEYEKMLIDFANRKKLGWSSGTAPHLVKREAQPNGSNKITQWPLGLDASYTHRPAEYRNQVISLKSYSAFTTSAEPTPNSEAEAATAAPQEGAEQAQTKTIPNQEELTMDEKELQAIVDKASELAADKAVKAFIASQPAVNDTAGVQVTKAAEDQPFGSAGEYFKAVRNAGLPNPSVDQRLQSLKAATGLNEAVPSEGGFLVPPAYAAGIVQNMHKVGTLLSYISPTGVSGNSMTWNVVDETSRANASRMGGVYAYWLAEAGTKTSSKPKFRQLELKLKKIAALCYATDEVLEDASALGSWLTTNVPDELRFRVEDSFINGDGVGKPFGILGSGSLISATRTDASEVDSYDVARMWARRYVGASDYVWGINSAVWPQLVNMSIGNMPVWVPPSGVSGMPYGTIFGRPVVELEYLPNLGTLGDILLFSPSQYYAIEKAGGVQSASSIHVNFIYDETAFRFVYRVDGAPLWYTTLTGFDTVTRSPFVVLAATT